MNSNRCDAPTDGGGRCNLMAETCESAEHRQSRRLSIAHMREVFENRDLRSVGWYWLELLSGSTPFDAKNAASVASIARIIHTLGEAPKDAAQAAAEAALFGGIMHGIPPRDAAQWEILERTYDPETLKDLRRWRPNPFTLGPDEDPASMPGPISAGNLAWDDWDAD